MSVPLSSLASEGCGGRGGGLGFAGESTGLPGRVPAPVRVTPHLRQVRAGAHAGTGASQAAAGLGTARGGGGGSRCCAQSGLGVLAGTGQSCGSTWGPARVAFSTETSAAAGDAEGSAVGGVWRLLQWPVPQTWGARGIGG